MQPYKLTTAEWEEIAALPTIRESWGLEETQGGETLADLAYAVKFKFVSGSPGYIGDLFILQGDVLTGDPPFVLHRGTGGALLIT